MSRHKRLWSGLVGLTFAMFVVGCMPTGSPGDSSCDGIDAQLGGCDADRAVFTGSTCAEVGTETGRELNYRLLAVYHGADAVNDESKAVRANHVMTVTTSLANQHLRSIGIVATCGLEEFVSAAETQFSVEFKQEAGAYLYDGASASFDDWLAEWQSVARIIDMDEG